MTSLNTSFLGKFFIHVALAFLFVIRHFICVPLARLELFFWAIRDVDASRHNGGPVKGLP